ncbi:uracil-xanthine permease [Shewanella sp. 202IG2-18]|uniref:uracil-xanthine permease family protein n=1 Tax=Parashewanella hymeniacidonis TaxID=2807618 RepID=UPI001960B5DF|nr:uracil-xanthine permease family protein [Parashewanella hymeniacidonis]MBM7072807.1 uracil-xanthine permease [Parashewanella hymeniacidonis]
MEHPHTTSTFQNALAGSQMLFVAFGAMVLMPILTGLEPSVAMFGAGIGTLLFQLVTKRMVPVFLASSFAFIAPISFSIQTWGMAPTMGGLIAVGFTYLILGQFVRWRGTAFLEKVLPPVVVGPVIMVIGLSLAPVAVQMAMGKSGDGSIELFPYQDALIVSMLALVTTLLVATLAKGLFRLIPILCGIIVGSIAAATLGMLDGSIVTEAAWIAMPNFVAPEFNWQVILFMLPVAIAPAIEHIGDVLAIGNVAGKDYVKKPGLHRTLTGDGIATSVAACFGAPPNTTYSEVTGAVMLTKNFNPVTMTWAACFAILLAFCGKLGALLQSIPTPVMGGILILLFGSIAAVGMSSLVKNNVDLSHQRNLCIVATILVLGIGGMSVGSAQFSLTGISLCGVVGILMNLLLPKADRGTLASELKNTQE